MAINLLELLQDQLKGNFVDQAADFLGESKAVTNSGIGALLPTILGSVIGKGATESGAGRLINMINDGKHDGGIFDNLGSIFGANGSSSTLINVGTSLLSALMGSKQGGILDMITSATGMRRSSSNSLMSMLAPMVMGMIGKYVRNKGLNAGGLMNLLLGQRNHVSSALPAGMGSLLGLDKVSASTGATASSTSSSSHSSGGDSSGGGGWWKWLLGALAALFLLGYFGFRTGCAAVDNAATTVSDTTTGALSYTKDAAGNLVDETGNVIAKAGEFTTNAAGEVVDATGNVISKAGDAVKGAFNYTKDAAGNLVDETGNVIAKAGEFTMDAAGNVVDATGNVISKAGEAVGNAVNYTKDAAGNLVDGTGKVIAKAGEYTMDAGGKVVDASGKAIDGITTTAGNVADKAASLGTSAVSFSEDAAGNLVDKTGKVVYKAGEFTKSEEGYYMDKEGNRIGEILGKVKDAVAGAATKTADAFKSTFSNMFKKDGASGSTYELTKIQFNPENQKISNYSKAEVEGLAAALKADSNAKIQVQAFTNDGGGALKNKELSSMRASIVKNMLVALGVDKGQISSKGMSAKDEAKAAANKVEIVVE